MSMHQPSSAFAVAASVISVCLSGCALRTAPTSEPSTARTAAAGTFETQVAEYVRAQSALAADDFAAAQQSLVDLVAISDAAVQPLAESAAAAPDMGTMRSAFKPLSEFLAAMDLPSGYARAYCPMYDGGSNWVQSDGPVRNPYYGSVMLTCGVVDAAPGAHGGGV